MIVYSSIKTSLIKASQDPTQDPLEMEKFGKLVFALIDSKTCEFTVH